MQVGTRRRICFARRSGPTALFRKRAANRRASALRRVSECASSVNCAPRKQLHGTGVCHGRSGATDCYIDLQWPNGGGSGAPLQAGDTITLNCSGLGAVDPPSRAGMPAPADPLSRVTNLVSVTVGGFDAKVNSAVLTPGTSGLYQVSATVPDGIPTGDAQILLSVAGQTSPSVLVTMR